MVITISIDPGNKEDHSITVTESSKLPPSPKRPHSSKTSDVAATATKNTDDSSSDDESGNLSYGAQVAPVYSRSRPRPSWSGRFVSKTAPHIENGDRNVAVQTENAPPLSDVDISGMQDKDCTIHLEMDIGLDISADIEQLSRLNQLGHFNEAIRLFHERLAPHVDFFPVTAEYADLRLEQGSFGVANAFISARLEDMASTFSPVELRLLRLLKAFAEIYTKGALIPALQMTKQTLENLEIESSEDPSFFKSSIGQHIHLVETCLRIIKYAVIHSSFLECSTYWPLLQWGFSSDKFTFRRTPNALYFNSPTSAKPGEPTPVISTRMNPYEPRVPKKPLPRLKNWYYFLVQEGYMWESHRLLQILLPLMGDCEGRYIPDGTFEDFFRLSNVNGATKYFSGDGILFKDEDHQVLTELANATLLAGFLNSYSADDSVRATQRHFFEKARSIAGSIASAYPNLLKSRPYLNWLYLAETEVSGLFEKLRTSNSKLFFPLVWCRDSMGGVQSILSTGVRLAGRIAGGSVTADATTFMQETNLRIILAAAEEQGDYRLQIFFFQALLNNCSVMDERADIIKTMSNLRQGVMKDAGGYLQCLIAEWRFFIDSNPDVTSETLMNLYSRIAEFNNSFPSHFDFKPEERQRLKLILFDVPIFVWMKHLAMERLLRCMDRNTEADIFGVRVPQIERHLPFHATSRLGMTFFRCVGCVDCGGDPYHPYNLPVYGNGHPYTQYPPEPYHGSHSANAIYSYPPPPRGRVARRRRSYRSVSPESAFSPRRVSRPPAPPTGLPSQPAIGHERHRHHTVEDDAAMDIEELIQGSREPGGRPQQDKSPRNARKVSRRERIRSASKNEKGLDGKKDGAINQTADDSSGVGYDSGLT